MIGSLRAPFLGFTHSKRHDMINLHSMEVI
ncbi:hypothetical protein NCTGTJJY_CDS0261 [Serratia phage 92A1]|nr:hypothetical protein NCTGTJJY_CDS0261 [Serratia phage 92A1]